MDIEIEEKDTWNSLRNKLNQAYKYDQIWEQAIQLFNTRLSRKYFNPIQSIINENRLEGEGFTIVTVQCALIEMFAAFKLGKIFNHAKNQNSPNYEYKESMKLFTHFLRTASIFEGNFWQVGKHKKRVIDSPFSSIEFYQNVRCGLMHEARTKANWHITATPKSMSAKQETIFLVQEHNKIKILRTVLHYRLLEYLSKYENELRQDNVIAEELRRYFARKLDHLFNLQADASFDWWIDR